MANTYTKFYVHIVFAVQNREAMIRKEIRERLEKHITGILQNKKCKVLAIYCMPDHVHILTDFNLNLSVSDVIRDLKSQSSRFLNKSIRFGRKFSWQRGYGAFSVSPSQKERTISYILNQPKRHQKMDFRFEYSKWLEAYQINYKPDYLFTNSQ